MLRPLSHTTFVCLCLSRDTATTFEEKERCLSSVISVLQNDPLLRMSTANLRALVVRAQVRHEYGMVDEALRDLAQATAMACSDSGNNNTSNHRLLGLAWRTQADCYQTLGSVPEAEEALRQWALCDPSCRTKVLHEIQALRQRQQP